VHRTGSSLESHVLLTVALVHFSSQGCFQVEMERSTAVNAMESTIPVFAIVSANCTTGAVQSAPDAHCSLAVRCSLLQYFLRQPGPVCFCITVLSYLSLFYLVGSSQLPVFNHC